LADYFASRNFAVYAYDHRGHGRSAGLKGYVHRFQDYVSDLSLFFDDVHRQNSGKPVFLLGHSIGGTITCAFAPDKQAKISGIVFSGAVAKPGASVTRLSIVMARALSVILPKLGISPIDASTISHDKNVVDAYVNDPLVYQGKIRARLGAELINIMERTLPDRYPRVKIPVLVMHGGEDRLSNIEGSKLIFNSIGSVDKTLKTYNGYYHEILNEAGKPQVLKDMEDWLNNHLTIADSR